MEYLTVGTIVNTHGIRGELKILPRTDFPEIRFRKGSVLHVSGDVPGEMLELEIFSSRAHKNTYLVLFKGFQNINEVEKFKGREVKVPANQRVDLDEDEYYYHDIIGCKVVTEEGEEIGVVEDILKPGANDVWVTSGKNKKKQILIPVIDDVVLDVDVNQKRIKIRLLEGME